VDYEWIETWTSFRLKNFGYGMIVCGIGTKAVDRLGWKS
jgi:hypothetical protein